MIIQIGHSKEYAYEKELYEPIKNSSILQNHTFILPHDISVGGVNSKETLQHVDIFLAEVSYPSTGLGIELGFAHLYGVKIICFSKENINISGSLKYVCNEFFTYIDTQDMISKIYSLMSS